MFIYVCANDVVSDQYLYCLLTESSTEICNKIKKIPPTPLKLEMERSNIYM